MLGYSLNNASMIFSDIFDTSSREISNRQQLDRLLKKYTCRNYSDYIRHRNNLSLKIEDMLLAILFIQTQLDGNKD